MPPPPRCIEPHSFTHRYGAGGAMGQCCPASAPPPPPRPMGVGVYGAAPPPTLHWTQFSMGQGALWGGSAPLLDPHSTQRGGGLWGSPPAFNPLLFSLYGAGGLYGVVLPRFWTPPIPMGGSMGQRCPTSTPPNPDLVGGGGRLMGQPPLGVEPHPIWGSGLYGAAQPHFWTPPIPMGALWGSAAPLRPPVILVGGLWGAPPPSHPTPLLSLYGAAGAMGQPPPPPPPPAMG